MSLSDAFPADYVRKRISAQLRPGAIVKLTRQVDDGSTKPKYYLVLEVTGVTISCIVNTRYTEFVARRPKLLVCQVALEQAKHEFMDHDCFIDCTKPKAFDTASVIDELVQDPQLVCGEATADLKIQVIAALKQSDLISPDDCARFCESLNQG